MFESTSRYYNTESLTLTITHADGKTREVAYLQRRFLPSADAMTTLVEHTVQQGERLDNITARYLGDPTQFWRLCDANEVFQPTELTDTVGRVIQVAMPQI